MNVTSTTELHVYSTCTCKSKLLGEHTQTGLFSCWTALVILFCSGQTVTLYKVGGKDLFVCHCGFAAVFPLVVFLIADACTVTESRLIASHGWQWVPRRRWCLIRSPAWSWFSRSTPAGVTLWRSLMKRRVGDSDLSFHSRIRIDCPPSMGLC